MLNLVSLKSSTACMYFGAKYYKKAKVNMTLERKSKRDQESNSSAQQRLLDIPFQRMYQRIKLKLFWTCNDPNHGRRQSFNITNVYLDLNFLYYIISIEFSKMFSTLDILSLFAQRFGLLPADAIQHITAKVLETLEHFGTLFSSSTLEKTGFVFKLLF